MNRINSASQCRRARRHRAKPRPWVAQIAEDRGSKPSVCVRAYICSTNLVGTIMRINNRGMSLASAADITWSCAADLAITYIRGRTWASELQPSIRCTGAAKPDLRQLGHGTRISRVGANESAAHLSWPHCHVRRLIVAGTRDHVVHRIDDMAIVAVTGDPGRWPRVGSCARWHGGRAFRALGVRTD